jgi:hypothetical protein
LPPEKSKDGVMYEEIRQLLLKEYERREKDRRKRRKWRLKEQRGEHVSASPPPLVSHFGASPRHAPGFALYSPSSSGYLST